MRPGVPARLMPAAIRGWVTSYRFCTICTLWGGLFSLAIQPTDPLSSGSSSLARRLRPGLATPQGHPKTLRDFGRTTLPATSAAGRPCWARRQSWTRCEIIRHGSVKWAGVTNDRFLPLLLRPDVLRHSLHHMEVPCCSSGDRRTSATFAANWTGTATSTRCGAAVDAGRSVCQHLGLRVVLTPY